MLNIPSATEERHEPSGKCQGISHFLESGHPEKWCCSIDNRLRIISSAVLSEILINIVTLKSQVFQEKTFKII